MSVYLFAKDARVHVRANTLPNTHTLIHTHTYPQVHGRIRGEFGAG